MRMWMVPPKYMCKRHIAGEHGEIHKHKHSFEKQHSISGRLYPVVQIEPNSMKSRHDELAEYLKTHKSPYEMPDLSYLESYERDAKVDMANSFLDLYLRCPACAKIISDNMDEIKLLINKEVNDEQRKKIDSIK